ncbi:MAG: FecR domain-containing protein [Anaerolineales bacterium]
MLHSRAMRIFWLTLTLLGALLLAACQRTLLGVDPPPTAPNNALATSTPERSATLKEVNGTVEARSDATGDWAAATAGSIFSVGGQLRTAAGSDAYFELTEGSRIRVGAETALTFNILNPFLDSQLTSLALERGQTWVLLNGGALDVETPVGLASARAAYMSVQYDAPSQTLEVMCLRGTCSVDRQFVPATYKYRLAGGQAGLPEPMALTDFGLWGINVPEVADLAAYATEVTFVGNATLAASTDTPEPTREVATSTPTLEPTVTPTPANSEAVRLSETPSVSPPTATPQPIIPTAQPLPTVIVIGQHVARSGETPFCIGRAYGVEPNAILRANNATIIFAGQRLRIPAVRWFNIASGPVCQPQFESPYPHPPFIGTTPVPTPLPLPTAAETSTGEPPSAVPTLTIREVAALCIGNCNDPNAATYRLRIIVSIDGGMGPYTVNPGPGFEFDLDFTRCTRANGIVSVTSADGQSASGSWVYDDVACPTSTPATP